MSNRLEDMVLIINPFAPVRAWARTGGKVGEPVFESRDFRNLPEFQAWYQKSVHGEARVNSQEAFTDVLVDNLADGRRKTPPLARQIRAEKGTADPPARVHPGRTVTLDGLPYPNAWAAFEAAGIESVPERLALRRQLLKTGRAVRGENVFEKGLR